MSLIKVTPEKLTNVCACGAENVVSISDLIIMHDSVTLPLCPYCKDCYTSITAQPYEEGWEGLDEGTLRRYIMAQMVHFFATQDPKTRLFDESLSREDLILRMEQEGRYEFIDPDVLEMENEVHPLKRAYWLEFKETGQPVLKRLRKVIISKDSAFKENIRGFIKRGSLDSSN